MLGPLANGALGVGENKAGGCGRGGHTPSAEGGGLAVRQQQAAARAYVVLSGENGKGRSGHVRMAGEERA